ncbi:MAG: DUF1289 domain-containing protein [Silanimonas sp.]
MPAPDDRAMAAAPEGGALPSSPCIRQCCLDDADECVGCGRTLDEIKAWHGADAAGRAVILRAAAARRVARAQRFPARR